MAPRSVEENKSNTGFGSEPVALTAES